MESPRTSHGWRVRRGARVTLATLVASAISGILAGHMFAVQTEECTGNFVGEVVDATLVVPAGALCSLSTDPNSPTTVNGDVIVMPGGSLSLVLDSLGSVTINGNGESTGAELFVFGASEAVGTWNVTGDVTISGAGTTTSGVQLFGGQIDGKLVVKDNSTTGSIDLFFGTVGKSVTVTGNVAESLQEG